MGEYVVRGEGRPAKLEIFDDRIVKTRPRNFAVKPNVERFLSQPLQG